MKKEELEKEIWSLKEINVNLESFNYQLREEVWNKKERIEDLEKQNLWLQRDIISLQNKIHFLAWMLYKEWVKIDNYCQWLDVMIYGEEKSDF